MPKSKAIGAISETIVLTNTPTSRATATSSPPFPPFSRSTITAARLPYLPRELFKLSYLCQSTPSQFRPPSPSALSVFQSFLRARRSLVANAPVPIPSPWLMIMVCRTKLRLSVSSLFVNGRGRERHYLKKKSKISPEATTSSSAEGSHGRNFKPLAAAPLFNGTLCRKIGKRARFQFLLLFYDPPRESLARVSGTTVR